LTARVIARVPLTFTTASGTTTHAPLVMASVGGAAEARFVLDTGSDVHLLNEDLADELGVDKEPGEEGIDHAGNTMPSWSVGDVPATLGGFEVVLRNSVAIPAPPPFPGFGIRGGLSPQQLHESAWSVLDFATSEMLFLDAVEARDAADFLRERSPAFDLVKLTRDRDFQALVVSAALEGFAEMPTLLNTGGKQAEYSARALPDLRPESIGRLGSGVSGADYSGGSVGSRGLVIAGRRVRLPNVHLREQMHDPQGMVGMDVLRGTVLTCAADVSRPVFWQIP
jgi:hypothetical protein